MTTVKQVKPTASPSNTVRLHSVLATTPEKNYRAFLDADAMTKWLPPNGFTAKVDHGRVGSRKQPFRLGETS